MRRALRDTRGATAVEFAFLAPLLFVLALGIVQFGLTLNNYITLTEAVRTATRQLAVSRGASTPYTATVNQIYLAAPNLGRGQLTVSMQVNGSACGSDTQCVTALSTAQGLPASVAATYPCKLVVMGHDFAPGCTLSSSMTEMIE